MQNANRIPTEQWLGAVSDWCFFSSLFRVHVCTTAICSWCYLVASDTGGYTAARYSAVVFAYWYCEARIILCLLSSIEGRGFFLVVACFVTTGEISRK